MAGEFEMVRMENVALKEAVKVVPYGDGARAFAMLKRHVEQLGDVPLGLIGDVFVERDGGVYKLTIVAEWPAEKTEEKE